jgi:hypothetical protein
MLAFQHHMMLPMDVSVGVAVGVALLLLLRFGSSCTLPGAIACCSGAPCLLWLAHQPCTTFSIVALLFVWDSNQNPT